MNSIGGFHDAPLIGIVRLLGALTGKRAIDTAWIQFAEHTDNCQ